eukprot:gene480-637_t
MNEQSPILDELRAMAVFATVVRCGSFAAAARALGLTRAVVSHHIRALEGRLGVPLAQRSTRSFSLTPAGEAFRVHCERLRSLSRFSELVLPGDHKYWKPMSENTVNTMLRNVGYDT